MKYKTWLLDWLEKYIKPSAKMRTYERYYGIWVESTPYDDKVW